MIELLFLLLPIAAAYGYFIGYRSVKKQQEDKVNHFSRDYINGVNYLLSDNPHKAVDLFLNIIKKQEENSSFENSPFEAELTLGNLFRSRGEVDKAIRIHKKIIESPNYHFEQKLLTKQQLAKDFMAIGFYDRAENLYIQLIDEPDFAEAALQQLTFIYQKTKEWKKAINISEKLILLNPKTNKTALSHYYCEYVKQLESTEETYKNLCPENRKNIPLLKNKENICSISLLEKAFVANPNCVRVSIMLAEKALLELDYLKAVTYLELVLNQNPLFVSEILSPLKYIYEELGEIEQFELFLIRANQKAPNNAIDLALIDIIEQQSGIKSAQNKLYQLLKTKPNPVLFHRFIQYQMNEISDHKQQHSLMLLQNMVAEYMKQGFEYRCQQCGFQSHQLMWCCPSCYRWETILPTSLSTPL